jgi:predicted dehydrogenase
LTLRFGIVGCGMIGRLYADRLRQLGYAVTAACDPDLSRAAELAPAGSAFRDHAEMFAAGALDVACICSPTPYHHGAVLDAAHHGLHVFLEKPMATTLAEAHEMSAAMTAAGRSLGFGLKMRFESVFSEAHRLVEEGCIGRVANAMFSFYQPLPPGERIWYANVGVLRDMLVHVFDLAAHLSDATPVRVRASTSSELGYAGEDSAAVDLVFDNGASAHVRGGYLPGFPDVAGREDIVFQLVGERGYIVGKRPDHLVLVNGSGARHRKIDPVDAFLAELRAFANAVGKGSPVPVGLPAGMMTQVIISAAETSSKRQCNWVDV